MNYAKIKYFDIANGPGVRTSLFVSGCTRHCKDCFNPETWNFNYGKKFTDKEINEILYSVDKPYIVGLSILGGDPLEYFNLNAVKKLVNKFREKFGYTKSIWMWTGYTIEEIANNFNQWEIVKELDYLVDGAFELDKKDLKLKYRGSRNQRIINIPKSQIFNNILFCDYMDK